MPSPVRLGGFPLFRQRPAMVQPPRIVLARRFGSTPERCYPQRVLLHGDKSASHPRRTRSGRPSRQCARRARLLHLACVEELETGIGGRSSSIFRQQRPCRPTWIPGVFIPPLFSLRIFTIFHPGVFTIIHPWVRFLSFYQFASFMATTRASFVERGGAPAPHRRTAAAARTAVKDAERGTSGAPRSGLDP